MTCTTKFAEIREAFICAIEELVPDHACDTRFRVALDEYDFDLWAEQHPSAALRRFTITNNFDLSRVDSTNIAGIDTQQSFTLSIAYPNQMRDYGLNNRRDQEDCMECDLHQIDLAIGLLGFATWPGGVQSVELVGGTVDDFDDVRILSAIFDIQYRRQGITL